MRPPEKPFRCYRGFTILELLCIILVVLFLIGLLMPALNKTKRISTRVICGTNLKGLGTAINVYANDHDGMYPQLPGNGPWTRELGFAYDMPAPDFSPGGAQHLAGRTITASWYLLVRSADVSPKSLVCPKADQVAFTPTNSNRDMVRCWDFGPNPYQHVSYSMHHPYGRFPADAQRTASFAVAADMSPWFENGHIKPPGLHGQAPQRISAYWRSSSSYSFRGHDMGNSWNHGVRKNLAGIGQNVLFGDGHSSYEKTSDVGVAYDNIYTFWAGDADTTEDDRRIGKNPTARDENNDAQNRDDSFLAI